MNPELAKQLIQGFAGALKGLRLYPLKHPAIGRQVQSFLSSLMTISKGRTEVRLGVIDGSLFLEDFLFTPDQTAAEEIAAVLQQLELAGVVFETGVTDVELLNFLGLLYGGGDTGEALAAKAVEMELSHIRLLPLNSEDEVAKPREIFGRALKVMENVFQDVRLGKIPSSREAMAVVKEMAELTIADPHALFALSMLKDYDNYTFTHSVNVSVISLTVGRACGLNEEQLRTIGLGGLLHDLGKLKVDVAIITKPGRLNDGELMEIRKHPGTGADLVEQMDGVTPDVIDIVLGHHLRYDRTGYPADAKGHKFSPMTDMTAIADTYDALTTLRSYQRPSTPRKAVERLRELAGTALHPEYTERFIAALGTYPVGTLVRLDSNELGLVVRVNTRDPDAVELKIIVDPDGAKMAEPTRLDLAGTDTHRIIAEVDPFTKGIDITAYLD
jgi:putative nucleotidyltransferase with HDIG domain